MAILSFEFLKTTAMTYLANWAFMPVRSEILLPANEEGTLWTSQWDNWLGPEDFGGVPPIIQLNGIVLTLSSDYTITQSGDGVYGQIELEDPPSQGANSIVLATFVRATWRDDYWQRVLQLAADTINARLLRSNHVDLSKIDDRCDPWMLIVKQAGRSSVMNLQTLLAGMGRALSLEEKILTPFGWEAMGAMQVGDQILNSSGGTQIVLGVYPQGEQDIYRVTFSDGSSSECTLDHLWTTRRVSWENDPYKTRTLAEIKEDRYNHAIQMCAPVEFQPVDLPLDPYLLGVLLGDGSMTIDARICNPELEILQEAYNCLPSSVGATLVKYKNKCETLLLRKENIQRGSRKSNEVVQALDSLGMRGCIDKTKFIPNCYKFSSAKDRVSLIQGLMDTDGYCSADGRILEYCTVSLQLAHDFRFLVQSIGGTCSLKFGVSRSTKDGIVKECGPKYRLYVSFPVGILPFRASVHKLERFKPRTKYPPHRVIRSVQFVGRKEAQCITVSAEDGLFITNDCILTHNSQYEGMHFDLSKASNMVDDTVQTLGEELDREVVAWRWRNSPLARAAWPYSISGPWGLSGFPGPYGG